jgi:hypothetical protein
MRRFVLGMPRSVSDVEFVPFRDVAQLREARHGTGTLRDDDLFGQSVFVIDLDDIGAALLKDPNAARVVQLKRHGVPLHVVWWAGMPRAERRIV